MIAPRVTIPWLVAMSVVFMDANIGKSAEPTTAVLSHPATRKPLAPNKRPLPTGKLRFVDSLRGDDGAAGTIDAPWRTISRAFKHISPGETIVLRGGIFYEQVRIVAQGTENAPITLRAYPNELVTIDAGLKEFAEHPTSVWEPVGDASILEFRSMKAYPGLQRALGNFGDSLLPLHAYRELADLRAPNEVPLAEAKGKAYPPCYFGPGVAYDAATERIHLRLAHTHLPAFEQNNYHGATDPRRLPLVISGWGSTPLTLESARHVHVQDIVLRGGGDSTLLVRGCAHISLEGLTLYVANRGLRVETTGHLTVKQGRFRGPMPPWGSRTVSKYRSTDSHLFVPVGTEEIERAKRNYFKPQCHDFEIAHCEFTDGHDGVYVGGVQRLKFHHNLVDNMNDDGIYLSAWGPPGSDVHIFQNQLSRCLTMFAFGLGRGQESDPGSGTVVYRNVIDLRAPVMYRHPLPEDKALTDYGRLCGDHGGPVWEPLKFYHNTVLTHEAAFRGSYAAGWGGSTRGTHRYVFNNLFVQQTDLPGLAIVLSEPDEFYADGNLHWTYDTAAMQSNDFAERLQKLPRQIVSPNQVGSDWAKHDLFADPQFAEPGEDAHGVWRLSDGSPAADAGVTLPGEWPDPLRAIDQGKPDLGAYPLEYTLDVPEM